LSGLEKKYQKKVRSETQESLAALEAETPTKGSFARAVLDLTPTKEERYHAEQEDVLQNYPESYRKLTRFPRKAMKAWLINRSGEALTEKGFTLLKGRDTNIIAHMFELEAGLDLNKPWPQGPCHECGMLEQVLDKWLQETDSKSLIQNMSDCGTIDWFKQGRFKYLPEDGDIKTSIFDKRTGQTAEIPTTYCVDQEWSIKNNWSASEAMLVDKDGLGPMVNNLFKKAGFAVTTTDKLWDEFASHAANSLATKPSGNSQERELPVPAMLATLSRELHKEATLTPVKVAAPQSPQDDI